MADPEKAFLEFERSRFAQGTKIPCMFNPETLKITRTNKWGNDAGGAGTGVATADYESAEPATMELSLWFDTTDEGTSVTKYTEQLYSRMSVDEGLQGSKKEDANGRPPTVIFHWGQYLHSFRAYITSMTLEFLYFSSKGVPLRAKVDLTLKQYEESNAFGRQNPTSGTPNPHSVHRVQPGETLDRIAAGHYGDPTKWRMLANANSIEDPLTIRPGSLLMVPELGSP